MIWSSTIFSSSTPRGTRQRNNQTKEKKNREIIHQKNLYYNTYTAFALQRIRLKSWRSSPAWSMPIRVYRWRNSTSARLYINVSVLLKTCFFFWERQTKYSHCRRSNSYNRSITETNIIDMNRHERFKMSMHIYIYIFFFQSCNLYAKLEIACMRIY